MCDFSFSQTILGGIAGLLFGYTASLLKQRFSTIDMFSEIIKEEILSVSKQADNLGGEFGIEKWHADSVRRIDSFFEIFNKSRYWNKSNLLNAIEIYRRNQASHKCTRIDLARMLCIIYSETRKMA